MVSSPAMPSPAYARIKAEVLELVARIPAGSVTTHAQIAEVLDVAPRQVAYLLATLGLEEAAAVPWYRSVSSDGSLGGHSRVPLQRQRLEEEGITFGRDGKIESFEERVRHPGKAPASARPHPARLDPASTPYSPPNHGQRGKKRARPAK